jgi:capsular exopolysaccharide synthesis family protein
MNKNTGNSKMVMVGGHFEESNEKTPTFQEFFYVYIWNKWYLYVLSFLLFGGTAYWYAKQLPPVYEINAKLLIEKEEVDYSPDSDWLKENLSFSVVSDNVANEIEVLTSYALMKAVVTDLQLNKRYYWKTRFSDMEGYQGFPVVVDSFALNAGIEKPSFSIKDVRNDEFDFVHEGETIGRYRFGMAFSNRFGAFVINQNDGYEGTFEHPEYEMKIDFLDLSILAKNYLENLQVNFADLKKESSILRLTLEDTDPRRGEDVLSLLLKKYNQLKFEEKSLLAQNTLNLIEDRLNNIGSELRSVEHSVEQYKLNNSLSSLSSSDQMLLIQKMNQLLEEQKDLELQISFINSMQEDFNSQREDDFELIPINLSLINVQIQELIQPYNELVLRRKQLLLTGQPSNPIVQSVNQDLQSLRTSISSALRNMKNDLDLELNIVDQQIEQNQARLKQIPRDERALMDKSRRKDITEELYVYLLKKKEETALSLIKEYSDKNIIDPPQSSFEPVGPSKKKIYLGGLVAGFSIPFLFIFVFQLMHDSVKGEDELKRLIPEQNFLGIITRSKGKEKQVVLRRKRNLVSENFRAIRTKLQFHHRNRQKTIMVTSSTSNEGKTFVAINLAMSFALSKNKTVLLDFDLHKPDINKYIEEDGTAGLSDFLSGEEDWSNIIQKSKMAPDLDYISSGPPPLNPSELLTPEKLSELFNHLQDHYDVVIVDTPPVGIISDAIVLNEYVTNTLYVVRSGFTKKTMIKRAKEMISSELLVNPSFVLNGIKKDKLYGYGYGYYKKYAV